MKDLNKMQKEGEAIRKARPGYDLTAKEVIQLVSECGDVDKTALDAVIMAITTAYSIGLAAGARSAGNGRKERAKE